MDLRQMDRALLQSIDEYIGSGGVPSRVLDSLCDAATKNADYFFDKDKNFYRAWMRAADKIEKLANALARSQL